MKRTVRPFFFLLILLVFIATLTSRAILRKGILSIELETRVFTRDPPSLNSTLLKHAAVEIGEEKSRLEIQQLLDGNFASQARHRTFVSWRRFIQHDGGDRNLPATLR
jgi:hypothetical protein